jgi:hypothetical protein
VLPALALAATLHTAPACSTSCPPQQQLVKVENASGPPLWLLFIGAGSGAPDGLRPWVTVMVPDGMKRLSEVGGDCGWRKNPCVIVVPRAAG